MAWCASPRSPYVRRDGKLVAVSWDEAFGVIKDRVAAAGSNVAAVAGDLIDCETMYAAKALLATLGRPSSKAARPAWTMIRPASPR